MFGVLLESRAGRQRRRGGTALSITAHIALIGAASVATAHSTSAPKEKPKPEFIVFTPAPAPKIVEVPRPPRVVREDAPRSIPTNVTVLNIVPPTVMPPSLPEINSEADPTPVVFALDHRSSGVAGRKNPFDSPEGGNASNDWRGNEVLMHITASGKPRYPEVLRQAGVDGSVLVQFSVDTLGKVDMNSIRVLRTSHDLFTQAVRAALPSFRFKPAEVNGRHVAALAEMPFEFQVQR